MEDELMEHEPKLIRVAEAREILKVSKPTMARLIKEGHFTVYENPRDRREKLLDAGEVERGPRPRIVSIGAEAQASKRAA
jgi:DNA-binding MarR family transcriptional regulator